MKQRLPFRVGIGRCYIMSHWLFNVFIRAVSGQGAECKRIGLDQECVAGIGLEEKNGSSWRVGKLHWCQNRKKKWKGYRLFGRFCER